VERSEIRAGDPAKRNCSTADRDPSIGSGLGGEHSPEESINYLSRRQLSLPDERGYCEGFPPIIYVSTKRAEKIFASAGTTHNDALTKGGTGEFKAMDLKTKVKIIAKYKTAKVTSNNFVDIAT
jgi:hypothetical protein